MARFNKIYAGPVTEPTPQVQERLAPAAMMPGSLVIESGDTFAQAGANTGGKVFVVQDNYLAQRTPDDAWLANDRIVAMELLDEQFFNVLVATGQNVTRGAGLTTNATGRLVLAASGNRIIARAEEAFNNTTGSDQLVRVRVARSGPVAA